jgi:hypothetical protein
VIELPITAKIVPLILAGYFMAISPLSGWRHGEVDGYQWEGKVYDEPSQYGIDNGRISKLSIKKDGKVVVHYNRGWDLPPGSEEDANVVNEIVKEYKQK